MTNINEIETLLGSVPSRRILDGVKQSNTRRLYGLRFPFDRREDGYFSKMPDLSVIRSNLRQLIMTEPGERVMLPDFGCPLRSLLFAPLDQELVSEMRERIFNSISTYMPNINILDLQVLALDEYRSNGLPSIKIILTCKVTDVTDSIFDVKVTL